MSREPLARKLAQAHIASLALADGYFAFSQECVAGAWDEGNRADIAEVMRRLLAGDEDMMVNCHATDEQRAQLAPPPGGG